MWQWLITFELIVVVLSEVINEFDRSLNHERFQLYSVNPPNLSLHAPSLFLTRSKNLIYRHLTDNRWNHVCTRYRCETHRPRFKSSTMWTGDAVRKSFIDFFVNSKAHKFYASSSVVPHDDPSLLFINAGMNQFKPLFLGTAGTTTQLGQLKRVANAQKCIRAGGKHNDLDDVGKDEYHHTFFEMLGSWSFGDYYKTETIEWAWTLLTEVYRLSPERLYVTYFGGDSSCPKDIEAKEIWLKFLPEERVLPFGAKDNFWEMGETGPCGPCSEIHYDRIGGRDATHLVNADDPSVVEIWNLVFTAFDRKTDGTLEPLPFLCVDTGMGLERLLSVLNGVKSNYDTDLFKPILSAIHDAAPDKASYGGRIGSDDVGNVDTAYRVIADHIRTLTVAISDGAIPSNEGRGYVLRRILRRAVRYGNQVLGIAHPNGWLYKLVDSVADVLGDAYPDIIQKKDKVQQFIREEETQFGVALENGCDRFKRTVERLPAGSDIFPGVEAFTLYTTYGFPLDLTEIMAREKGFTVDVAEFWAKFAEHQLKSDGKSVRDSTATVKLTADKIAELKANPLVTPTDDDLKYVWDSETRSGPVQTVALLSIWDGNKLLQAYDGDRTDQVVGLIADKTNFYSEQGGQVADTGLIEGTNTEMLFQVFDVQKFGPYILHIGKFLKGAVKSNDGLSLHVDFKRRSAIAKNHTATHLLNSTLRKHLEQDEPVDQQGSLVDESRLRFDFNYKGPVPPNKLEAVEDAINNVIKSNSAVKSFELPLESARSIRGLRAVFGETYPDPVRVVSVGAVGETETFEPLLVPNREEAEGESVELCGGTHVKSAGEIGKFIISAEEGIAKGIRRITAVTGGTANTSSTEMDKLKAEFGKLKESWRNKPLLDAEKSITALKLACEAPSNGLVLPLRDKRGLLAALDQEKSALMALTKAKQKQLLTEGKNMGKILVDQLGVLDVPCLIVLVPCLRGDAKALDQMQQVVLKGTTSIKTIIVKYFTLISWNYNSEAVDISSISFSTKEPAISANFSLSEWLSGMMDAVGGKAGGGPHRAAGSATVKSHLQKPEALIELVTNFGCTYADQNGISPRVITVPSE